jgi:hypothetical protein
MMMTRLTSQWTGGKNSDVVSTQTCVCFCPRHLSRLLFLFGIIVMKICKLILLTTIFLFGCPAFMSQKEQAQENRVREVKSKEITFVYDRKDFGKIEIKSEPSYKGAET